MRFLARGTKLGRIDHMVFEAVATADQSNGRLESWSKVLSFFQLHRCDLSASELPDRMPARTATGRVGDFRGILPLEWRALTASSAPLHSHFRRGLRFDARLNRKDRH